jgi:hypothetical protein
MKRLLSWFDMTNGGDGTITRQPSGYINGGYASGIASAAGQWHARLSGDQPCIMSVATPCYGPFTRWGGYGQTCSLSVAVFSFPLRQA